MLEKRIRGKRVCVSRIENARVTRRLGRFKCRRRSYSTRFVGRRNYRASKRVYASRFFLKSFAAIISALSTTVTGARYTRTRKTEQVPLSDHTRYYCRRRRTGRPVGNSVAFARPTRAGGGRGPWLMNGRAQKSFNSFLTRSNKRTIIIRLRAPGRPR